MARTGIPAPCIATRRSKLRLLPNIGNTAGSPESVKKRGLSYHAARTRLAGCCPYEISDSELIEPSILVTSERGSPVIIATRDLLQRPDSRETRPAAACTALFLNS